MYTDDYWDGARFTFDARERIVFANPFEDRSTAYLDRADGAERAAFLFHHPLRAAAFEGMLRLASARYRKERVEGFELFYAIEPEVQGVAEISIVAATASDNAIDAVLAFDRDGTTRWTTLAPQRPGMWFDADLGAAYDVAEVAFLPRYASTARAGRGPRRRTCTGDLARGHAGARCRVMTVGWWLASRRCELASYA